MSISEADIAFAHELFSDLGPLTTRKMMGGLCLYHEGQIFAILSDEAVVFVKASGALADELASEGSRKFAAKDGRSVNYWTLPDAALDDPEEAAAWARKALAALR